MQPGISQPWHRCFQQRWSWFRALLSQECASFTPVRWICAILLPYLMLYCRFLEYEALNQKQLHREKAKNAVWVRFPTKARFIALRTFFWAAVLHVEPLRSPSVKLWQKTKMFKMRSGTSSVKEADNGMKTHAGEQVCHQRGKRMPLRQGSEELQGWMAVKGTCCCRPCACAVHPGWPLPLGIKATLGGGI